MSQSKVKSLMKPANDSWVQTTIAALGRLHCGQSPPSAAVNSQGDGVLYVSGPEQWDGHVVHRNKWTTIATRMAPARSIFITVKGSGVGTLFPGVDAAIGRDIYAFEPHKDIEIGFVYRALQFSIQDVIAKARGDIPGLTKSHILDHSISVAGVATQRKVVSRIDELFSRIDEGERALKRVQVLIGRYRQSVLKAAVTGELTRAWREQRKGKLESGDALLARILKARRAAWEKAGLDKMKAKGIKPTGDAWKQKYEEPGDIATDYLGDLPEGWQRVRIDAVGEVQLGRQRSPEHHDGDYMRPYLRVANVYEERIDTNDIMRMNFTPEESAAYSLRNGDILLNEGQSKELVGRPAMYKGELPGACFTNTLVRFRSTSAVLPEFAMIVFLYYMKSGGFQKIAKVTTNIAHLGAGRFADMSFPVPSLEEQRSIVDFVDRQNGAFSTLAGELVARQRHAGALRQSVLKAAFSGMLVTQDPSDESASDLLERIAATRQSSPAVKPTRSRKVARRAR